MELLNVKLSKTEDKLDYTLKSLGSLKEDEIRAREQLEEIKGILASAKEKITSYKLPVIPKCYYVELDEATEAIREMMKVSPIYIFFSAVLFAPLVEELVFELLLDGTYVEPEL